MTNLDRCWKNCLRMWKWISENYDENNGVLVLKRDWFFSHRFKKRILAECFFCEWAGQNGQTNFVAENGCPECPGALVDARFKCGNIRYEYSTKPKAFYAKLLELDAKRTGKKKP